MMGVMGIGTITLLWPVILLLHATGAEPFALPSAYKAKQLAMAALLDAVYEAALLFGLATTSPVWMSVATILVVPASLLADWVLHSASVSPQAAGGLVLIIVGFACLQVTDFGALQAACRKRVSGAGAGAGA